MMKDIRSNRILFKKRLPSYTEDMTKRSFPLPPGPLFPLLPRLRLLDMFSDTHSNYRKSTAR